MPGDNIPLFAHSSSSTMKWARFDTKHLWVTPYTPAERYPAGDYPNQHPRGAGLAAWTQANRSLVNTELVLWYTVGVHHVPWPEDWPIMPVNYAGFMLKPAGFFDRNPALDVPPAPKHRIVANSEISASTWPMKRTHKLVRRSGIRLEVETKPCCMTRGHRLRRNLC